jgi:hypothetical protein
MFSVKKSIRRGFLKRNKIGYSADINYLLISSDDEYDSILYYSSNSIINNYSSLEGYALTSAIDLCDVVMSVLSEAMSKFFLMVGACFLMKAYALSFDFFSWSFISPTEHIAKGRSSSSKNSES